MDRNLDTTIFPCFHMEAACKEREIEIESESEGAPAVWEGKIQLLGQPFSMSEEEFREFSGQESDAVTTGARKELEVWDSGRERK